jgi:tRNA(adenine34) deaminase
VILESPWRDAFDMAWESWCAGSMGIGAVLVDDDGTVVARGRNRVLEERGGAIAGTLLAHAEMDALARLGLRTAAGLTLYTTVEPCLLCSAAVIAMRTPKVRFATADPVFEGLDAALAAHPYCADRTPDRQPLGDPVLEAFASMLPLANRVWSKPGQVPRPEWLRRNASTWDAAVELVESGALQALAADGRPVSEVIQAVEPTLRRFGAVRP